MVRFRRSFAGRLLLLLAALVLCLVPLAPSEAFASLPWAEPSASRGTGDSLAGSSTLRSSARVTSTGVVFTLEGPVPPGADEAILWYDTVEGHRGRRYRILPGTVQRSVTVSFLSEGLKVTHPLNGRLDYWWALRGSGELLQRRAGSVLLPSKLSALAKPADPLVQEPFVWSEATSEHFRFRFYPGSAAERDIEQIKALAEDAYDQAAAILAPSSSVSITTYLVPRMFWQGGVAYDRETLLISYVDRNYAGVDLPLYLLHETVHALAHHVVRPGGQIGGLIGEGIAVHATGGHYGPEPVDAWAATLQRSDRFVPLCRLRVTFPEQQHEIAYLEAASFVGYLIRTYGLPAFREFYAGEPAIPDDANDDLDAFCAAEARRPVAGIGKSYEELEAGWLAHLDTVQPTENQAARFWGQVRFFDLMRAYQERKDPAARVLPPPPTRWTSDLQRLFATPALTETNVVQEALLVAVDRALDDGRSAEATSLMDEVAASLDGGAFTGAAGKDYLALVRVLDRHARAHRLGDPWRYAATMAPFAPPLKEALWVDYRLELRSISLRGSWAIARVERIARPLDGPIERAPLTVTLRLMPAGWRIASIQPDAMLLQAASGDPSS